MSNFPFFTIFSAVGLWYINEFLKFADFHKVVYNQQPGICHDVEGVFSPIKGEQGAEDIEVLPNGIAIFSSGLNYMRNPILRNLKGRMLSFNFNHSAEGAKELRILGFKGKLNPHGISLWNEKGEVFVYVIHHAMEWDDSDESVEKFLWDVAAGTLTHKRTIKDGLFTSLNDLVMIGLDKFYVTNDYTFRNNWLRRLEYFAFLPTNNVVYFDGKRGHQVIHYLRRANGINISPDHRFLYVAEAGAKRLSTYEILPLGGELQFVSSRYLGTIPDNLNVDSDTGDVWVGSHPVGYKIFLKVAYPVGAVAPSLVLKLKMEEGHVTKISQIYANDGTDLVASGGASFYKGGVLIGTPTHKLVFCECLIC